MSNNNNNNKIQAPTKFTGLHAHSTLSIGDAIGTPNDHMDFAVENGMDSLALTDHGNMNGFSHQYLHAQNLKKQGITFKALYGIEAYFVPSLQEWKGVYNAEIERKRQEKMDKKEKEIKARVRNLIGAENADAEEDLEMLQAGKVLEDENLRGDSGVENEEESKNSRWKNPLYQRNHLVLLPKNNEGLKALFKCISSSYVNGFYRYPRMDFDLLKTHANGNIIATSACIAGMPAKIVMDNQVSSESYINIKPNDTNYEKIQTELAALVHRFQETLGKENYYLEIQFNRLNVQHLVNMHLIECSKRTGAKLVVTCDSHYSRPEYWREREIYKAMSQLQFMKNGEEAAKNIPKTIDELKCELYPKNAQQIWETYKNTSKEYDFYDDQIVKDAVERSHSIAHDQIGVIEPDKKVKLPAIAKIIDEKDLAALTKELSTITDEDDLAFAQLKKEAVAGAKWRGIAEKDEYIQRLVHELKVVKKLKFAKYFLTYAQIMKITSKEMLIGNARGSAGGSLLAYVLNITQLDPIKNGLLFERFLTATKKGFPDIDTDFGDRERAVKILIEHFGEKNVIPVSNFNQLQMKSLVKDICRLQGLPFDEINKYTKKIEIEARNEAKKRPNFDAAAWDLTFEEANENSPTFRELMTKYPELEKSIKILFKQMRNISKHAGGVIITDDATDNMPIVKSGDSFQTPWPEGLNFRHLETFGFLKFDILSIGTLRMFENTIRRILKKEGNKYPTFADVEKFFYDKLHPLNNEMNDINVYKNVYWKRNYAGIFQFVQQNVQTFISQMRPTNIIDIAVATSIYRPGPLGIGADKAYLKNRLNPETIVYKHPLLKEVLEPTFGLIIFQEQLQMIYHKLAGVPLENTDDIRKAFTKKDKSSKDEAEKERLRLRNDFAEKCLSVNQIPNKISFEIFDEMERFIAYSFNKSHAVAYAITSYQCAWFLTYYPDEWIASHIDYCVTEKGKVSGKEDPKAVAFSDAKVLGYKISKPDINYSGKDTEVRDKKVFPSFESLKGVGSVAVNEIQKMRPYKTVEDLLWSGETWRHSKFNKRALETLVCLEAFESLDIVGEGKMFKNYKQLHYVVVENNEKLKRAITKKKKDHKEVLQKLIEESQSIEDWTDEEKIAFSQELTGSIDINLLVTPEMQEYFNSAGIKSVDKWCDEDDLYWAIVDSCKIATTSTGKKYCMLSVYGESMERQRCSIWNFNESKDKPLPRNILIIAKFKKNNFGLSCLYGKLEVLERI